MREVQRGADRGEHHRAEPQVPDRPGGVTAAGDGGGGGERPHGALAERGQRQPGRAVQQPAVGGHRGPRQYRRDHDHGDEQQVHRVGGEPGRAGGAAGGARLAGLGPGGGAGLGFLPPRLGSGAPLGDPQLGAGGVPLHVDLCPHEPVAAGFLTPPRGRGGRSGQDRVSVRERDRGGVGAVRHGCLRR